ncbi:MAG: asparagine synthase (glutamine-hydrolyzing), partial [Verrucomicrobiota bacterium]
MCGIAGIFNLDGKPVAINTLKDMTDVIAHRGPDGEGFWTDSFVGFGHRRLAIIDLTPRGHQPMRNDEGNLTITYNGEVYNFRELRRELEGKGYTFKSDTDTEVVLKAYEEWGRGCLDRLNGMFAFAVWDARSQEIFVARDRYGIKPVYYYFANNLLVFASEVKSILRHPDISARVCVPALNEYFSFQNIFTDLTLFDGIKLLPAGHWLSARLGDASSLRTQKYWDFHFEDGDERSEQECMEELAARFDEAVRRQMVSDVEVGAYLSGGMDSGAVTCVAASQFKHIKTFTCGFDLSSASGIEIACDEREKAEFLSNLYKTEHYEAVLKAGDMERVMPELIWHLEDLRVGQCYPNFYVSRLAGKFVKVVLGGSGGDELFAGYPWRYYTAVVNDNSEQYMEKYYRYWQRLIPDRLKQSFFQSDLHPGIEAHPTIDVFRNVMGPQPFEVSTPEEYVNRSLYFEIKTFMHGVLAVEDKLSMSHGLESRVPFLDNDLVEFAMKIPVRHKLRDLKDIKRLNENEPGPKTKKYFSQTNDGKIILRKALNKYVPQDYTEGLKQGFSAPDGSWFRGERDHGRHLPDRGCRRPAERA